MEMQQTRCYATELLRYYGNAIWCIDHATKETQHVTLLSLIMPATWYYYWPFQSSYCPISKKLPFLYQKLPLS
jgi:hypothetical protein